MTPLILAACWLAVVFAVTGLCMAARSGDTSGSGDPEHEHELECATAGHVEQDVSTVAL